MLWFPLTSRSSCPSPSKVSLCDLWFVRCWVAQLIFIQRGIWLFRVYTSFKSSVSVLEEQGLFLSDWTWLHAWNVNEPGSGEEVLSCRSGRPADLQGFTPEFRLDQIGAAATGQATLACIQNLIPGKLSTGQIAPNLTQLPLFNCKTFPDLVMIAYRAPLHQFTVNLMKCLWEKMFMIQ